MIRNRAATEARLLAAAKEHLELHGFMHFGINTVAARAGADKVLIYRYFGGQQGLLKALGQEPLFPHDGLIQLYFQNAALGQERMEAAISFYTRWVEEHPLTRMLFASENAVPLNPLVEAFRSQRLLFEGLLADAVGLSDTDAEGADKLGANFSGHYLRHLSGKTLFTEALPAPKVSSPRTHTSTGDSTPAPSRKKEPVPIKNTEQAIMDEGGLPENLL